MDKLKNPQMKKKKEFAHDSATGFMHFIMHHVYLQPVSHSCPPTAFTHRHKEKRGNATIYFVSGDEFPSASPETSSRRRPTSTFFTPSPPPSLPCFSSASSSLFLKSIDFPIPSPSHLSSARAEGMEEASYWLLG